jgi:hypothetical protein
MALSNQLAKLTERAEKAQTRAAAAENKTRRDLETDVAAARASAHAEAVRLGELANAGRGEISIDYAYAAIEQAEYAVLHAEFARTKADDLRATARTTG